MSLKHLVLAVVLVGLWVPIVSAQVKLPTTNPTAGAASGTAGAAASSTGLNSPNVTTNPNAVVPTMDTSAQFPLQGTPSTGSDASSPPAIPGSPPTAPR